MGLEFALFSHQAEASLLWVQALPLSLRRNPWPGHWLRGGRRLKLLGKSLPRLLVSALRPPHRLRLLHQPHWRSPRRLWSWSQPLVES